MTDYLLDSHIWFWHLMGSDRLPQGLRDEIDVAPKHCHLSPISLWEIGMLVSRGRLRVEGPYRDWLEKAHGAFPVKIAPLNQEVALTSLELDLPHRDPADHFLAATALVYDLTLMTVDRHLREADWLSTKSR